MEEIGRNFRDLDMELNRFYTGESDWVNADLKLDGNGYNPGESDNQL